MPVSSNSNLFLGWKACRFRLFYIDDVNSNFRIFSGSDSPKLSFGIAFLVRQVAGFNLPKEFLCWTLSLAVFYDRGIWGVSFCLCDEI
jgi:hypothetical protein